MGFDMTEGLFCTVGCHPCSAYEFDKYPAGKETYLEDLSQVIAEDIARGSDRRVVAVGECGLGKFI